MRIGKLSGKRFALSILLIFAAMALVACGAGEGQETAEPLGGELEETPLLEETPMVEETPLLEETPVLEEETPLAEETVAVEETPMVEETPVMEETPEVEETPMVEETPTVEAEATEPAEDETPVAGEVMTNTGLIRSDNMLDMIVADQDGAILGDVRDVLFDMQGNVQYVVLDLTLDEARTVAVSMDQLEVRQGTELTGGVDDEANAQDETPEPAVDETPSVDQAVLGDGFVVVYTGQQADLDAEADIDIAILDEEGELVNLDDLGLEAAADATDSQVLQASEFDYDLINQNDDDLGEVEELILNVAEGRVAYAVVDVGGFLGIGETTVALPWDQLQFSEADEAFIVNADEETLTNAPTIDFDEWQNGMAPNADWGAEIDEFWNNLGDSS